MGKSNHYTITRYRSADHGRFVKKSYADRYPTKTIKDRMKVHPDDKKRGK